MYFTKINLRGAYTTKPVLNYQKYLKFANKNDLYKFVREPNGYRHKPWKLEALDKAFTNSI